MGGFLGPCSGLEGGPGGVAGVSGIIWEIKENNLLFSFGRDLHQAFFLEVFRRNGYTKYTGNICTNSFFVNILFLPIYLERKSYGKTDTYALMGCAETTSVS